MDATTSLVDQPAILGGTAAITLSHDDACRWPIITSEDEEAVLRTLRTGSLGVSEETAALEADFREWTGRKYAVAHCNGTSAIFGAMHAFELEAGDEVIVPSATWWSSVMPILHFGGVPVFAELEGDCLGLDPEDIERKITDRTKAIVVVHLFGMPSKMDEIIELAERYDLKILEDASHAHGATYKGRMIGSMTEAAVFSMQGNKLLPSAEGGVFLTDDETMYEAVLRLGHYERLLDLTSMNKYLAATGLGYKFRMSPLSAALGRVQLRHLDERNAIRNANCIELGRHLESLGMQAFLAPEGVERTYFEYLVRYDEAATGLPIDDFTRALQAEGAQLSAPRYPLLHQMPVFTHGIWKSITRLPDDGDLREYDENDLPGTTEGNGSLIKLPAFPNEDHGLIEQYKTAFSKVFAHADALPRADA
ncbi:MAG: DegT/DnrJ/EryC1/StrS family aminotransferase [Phycisphaerales bacterium]|nr:DegT/DnrJ/EryC1/StrS family aminotransferase [Phycisphaerales bacterium]